MIMIIDSQDNPKEDLPEFKTLTSKHQLEEIVDDNGQYSTNKKTCRNVVNVEKMIKIEKISIIVLALVCFNFRSLAMF